MTEIVGSLVILMLIGAVAGLVAIRRANTRKEVMERQTPASSGQLTVKFGGTRDIGPADLPYWGGDRRR